MSDDRVYLENILESIDAVDKYTVGGEAVFLSDSLIRDAVLRRMETLTDAASHVSDALKKRHPEIQWSEVTRFRNVLAHG